MTHAIAFLAGGIVIGSLFIGVLFDEAGQPTSAFEKVNRAIRKIRELGNKS